MEIVYRSYDGVEFSNAEECFAYEKTKAVRMYDKNGLTTDFESSLALYFPCEKSFKNFLARIENSHAISDGIDDNSEYYLWSGVRREWFPVEPNAVTALYKLVTTKGND